MRNAQKGISKLLILGQAPKPVSISFYCINSFEPKSLDEQDIYVEDIIKFLLTICKKHSEFYKKHLGIYADHGRQPSCRKTLYTE